jgi:hypothetical protein
MDLRRVFDPAGYVAIPPIFHSVREDGPFRECIHCGTDLLAS